MTDAARRDRNTARLKECYPTFRERISLLIQRMEMRGLRPRIQTAARSPQEQLEAYNRGTSKLKFGFHNVTGVDGRPEALAVDILDDDAPLTPGNEFLIALAYEASRVGCVTGIAWGLPEGALKIALYKAVSENNTRYTGKIGWDPTHVEPLGLTVARAKAGERPPLME
jgi:hypothetical protein